MGRGNLTKRGKVSWRLKFDLPPDPVTHLTHLLEAGVDIKTVSERAGHTSVSVTLDLYGHVLESMQEKAALAAEGAIQDALKSGA